MNEGSIQNFLYVWLQGKGHTHIVPNCGAFGWEADLLSFTKNKVGIEYEIKISKSDFRSDAKKSKHKHLKNGTRPYRFSIPNQFYYVMPKNMVSVKEIPSHAGLIYIHSDNGCCEIVKRAPKLHTDSIRARVIDYINRGLMLRYWKQRMANV